jgi:trehalose/maltose hydrolase-like predicted phosphorylase
VVLCRGLELLDQLPGRRGTALRKELGLTPAEVSDWDNISRRMYIPFHGDGIISQFEGYLGCLLLSGLRILIGSSPERTETRDREVQEIFS